MAHDKASPLVGIILTALSVLLVVGILTFAGPCPTHDDGSVGSCVWAARAVLGVGLVLFVISVVRIFERDEGERRGLSLAAALLGVLVACLPGLLVDLCASEAMRCHATLRPLALCAGVAIAVVGGSDLVVRLIRLGRRQ